MNKRIIVCVLIMCLTITSCIGFSPQVWAADSGAGSGYDENDLVTPDPDNNEDDSVTDDEDAFAEPEQDIIINAWDEDGFYHDETGQIVKNKICAADGLVYQFDSEGIAMLYSGEFDGLQYKNGQLLTGWLNGLRYKNGQLYTGWYNYKYYKEGSLLTGIKLSDQGVPFYFTDGVNNKKINYLYNNKRYVNGKLYTGVFKSYFFDEGVKVTKYKNKVKKMSNGKFYFFKNDATVFKGTGWKRINGKRYYFKNGTALTGWNYVGNYKYYFRKDNARLCQDLIALQGSKWKKKDLMIKVNREANLVTIYAKDGNKGYTIPVKALTCSVGKKTSPTITGTYTLKWGSGLTYRWHTLGGPGISPYCYGQYCVRIHKSWLFHSVTYDEPDKMTLQTYTYNQLGTAASHGCVRLQVKDAKLIYEIVKNRNTKVKIYDSDYAGPFDKPVISKIPAGQKYDPTDPYVKK